MARGHKKKNSHSGSNKNPSRFRGNRHSAHKPKNRKKNKRKFESEDKPNQDAVQKRQKLEDIPAEESSSDETEEETENPLKKLLCTFNTNNADKKSVAVESEESEEEAPSNDNEKDDELSDESVKDELEEPNEESSGEEERDDNESNEQNESEAEDNSSDESSDAEKEQETQEDLSLSDPFVTHLCYDLSDDFVEFLETSCEKSVEDIEWPILGKLSVYLPKHKETTVSEVGFTIIEKKKFASVGTIPTRIHLKNLNLTDIAIKSQIVNNVKSANKCLSTESSEVLTPFQSELFSIINNYQDLYYSERTFENAEEIRFVYSLHAINHILKTRIKVLHHNARLKNKSDDIVPDEFRDQGLVRPKVLIVVPFRDCALKIVRMLIDILVPDEKGQVINKLRFMDDFSGGELILPKKNPKPEDYEKNFTGNCDDTFKIGIQVTKKSLKLYADFYSSDIIIASPLGLRLTIGAEGEGERDYDFLASIEVLILDQTELFLMQNWDHVIHVLNHLHMQPKDSHGTDFSRIRSWALNGWTKYYRQTLIFSSFALAEFNSIFNKKCFNYAGAIKSVNPVSSGSILNVHVQVPQIYRKFFTVSFAQCINDRFDFFVNKVLPQYKDTIMKQCLIYVPSYFDYVRIRNYFKKEDISFVQICEYSKDAKVARARDIFFHGDTHFLLYSERFHYFRRIRIKGIRHIIFYQPPTFPHFYSEMCNFMQEANQNKKCGSMSNISVTTIYSKYDAHQLSSILGSDRVIRMATSMKNFHMFTSSDS